MLSIVARNINEAYYIGMMHFRKMAKDKTLLESHTRGERRWQCATPIATTYLNPMQRVLFDPLRDANPFFHFMESLWIIGRRNDVRWLAQWLPSIADYSDDGEVFHGAYGFRIDNQVDEVVRRLQKDPNSTRAVLAVYQPELDSTYNGKDMPCNCTIFLGMHNGRLNLTVANRSNDMIWGAYGANVVQFSMLQEYLAARIGAQVGWYMQMSNNAHIYPDKEITTRILESTEYYVDPYDPSDFEDAVTPYPMGECNTEWEEDLSIFLYGGSAFRTAFFIDVVWPIRNAHYAYREKDWEKALNHCNLIRATDWRLACENWIIRREMSSLRKTQ